MQSDLFNLSLSNSFERQAFQKSFFERKYSLRADQLIGIGLVLIVFFVLVFAWGVERGKSVAQRDWVKNSFASASVEAPVVEAQIQPPVLSQVPAANLDEVSLTAAPAVVVTGTVDVPAPTAAAAPAESDSATIQTGSKYTIAHMTYLKKEQAKREIERIQAKGYQPFLVPSGKFYQLCVSGFDSRQSANEALRTMRVKGIVSTDSYIRNMPSH